MNTMAQPSQMGHGEGPSTSTVDREESPPGQAAQLRPLRKEQYLSLTTFRRDGRAVPTPVWFVIDGDRLLVHTHSSAGKLKRIRHNPAVTVAACTGRGRVTGPVLQASALILPESAGTRVERLFSARYPVAKPVLGAVNGLLRLVRRRPAEPGVDIQISLR